MGIEDGFYEVESLVDFVGGDIEGGEEADGFGTGGGDEEAFCQEDGAEVDGGDFAFGDFEGVEV